LDHRHAKINQAVEQTQGTGGKDKAPQKKYYFPQWKRDPNVMDVDRLTVKECNNKKKGKEVPKEKMNGRELHTHVRTLFKEMMEEDRDEFLKGAEEVGF
jgi:hypothetical protein